ncbi:MAG: AbrB/MazE/SpoVT family DNA-binding domain-containing protein [Propionibacteriaceae bacterium]|jgi:AbrB family looped-hinge helix DNA binding protein|nr:AbrB/MazE/SpoVT family DNA-binding domain-containing protein [Propionibacteriaceae bacterium]
MAILTIRDKNQVTIPRPLLVQAGLQPGDPIEFRELNDGGIGIYPYARRQKLKTLGDLAAWLTRQTPGIAETDLDLPPRSLDTREVEW